MVQCERSHVVQQKKGGGGGEMGLGCKDDVVVFDEDNNNNNNQYSHHHHHQINSNLGQLFGYDNNNKKSRPNKFWSLVLIFIISFCLIVVPQFFFFPYIFSFSCKSLHSSCFLVNCDFPYFILFFVLLMMGYGFCRFRWCCWSN